MCGPIDHMPTDVFSLPSDKPEAALGPWADYFPAWAELVFSNGKVRHGGDEAGLTLGPKGMYGLSHRSGSGRALRLTSALDPQMEDRTMVTQKELNFDEGLLCLGLGLGYHLLELARRMDPQTPLWVMESRPELAACALMANDLTALLARPGFRLFIGPFIAPPWGPEETPPAQTLWRPATLRHFRTEYPGPGQPAAPRRQKGINRLLLFQSGYFLDRELANAAKEQGLDVEFWNFQRGPVADGDDFRRLLETIKTFRPEMVLTVNHLGFDEQGLMDDLLTRLGLPAASWFVDSPVFILGQGRPGPGVSVFSWDRDYMPYLADKGFNQVHYLPLATDPNYFYPPNKKQAESRAVSFVGDSLTGATTKYLGKLGFNGGQPLQEQFLKAVDRLAFQFLDQKGMLPEPAALKNLAVSFSMLPEPGQINDLAALVTWRASRLWRLKVLKSLNANGLTIAGDQHWLGLLPVKPDHLLPPLDYYHDLRGFYQNSLINVNITSAQMKTGLNQRVFDVPASGAFLLTDRREQLFEHFEPGREVVTYADAVEAGQLAAWYLGHPVSREKIAASALKRIQDCHLYRHRLREMLAVMNR